MKRVLGHILIVTAIVLSIASCGKREKIIPRHTMSSIFASMCMADQWMMRNPASRAVADTTEFYAPVFKAYGYEYDDFRRSVDKYLKDPERFAKILKRSTSMLRKRAKILSENVEYLDQAHRRRELSYEIAAKPIYYDTLFLKASLTDTIDIQTDSRGVYLPVRIVPDTSYFGPHMFVREPDTLSVQADSTLVEEVDTRGSILIVRDAVKTKDQPKKSKTPLVRRPRTAD